MQNICQRDPRWKNRKIGQSDKTIGTDGCTLSSITYLDQWFNPNRKPILTPAYLAGKKDLFLKDARIIWDKLNQYLENFEYVGRFYKFDYDRVVEALKDPDQAVIIEVDNHEHWVAGNSYGRNQSGYFLKVMDPWFGELNDPLKTWHSLDGFVLFRRKAKK